MQRTKLILIGARPDGGIKTILDIVAARADIELLGLVDDRVPKGTIVNNVSVLGSIQDVLELTAREKPGFAVCIGDNQTRRTVFERALTAGAVPLTLIHPSAILSPQASVGQGCLIFPRVVVNGGSHIGDNVILNTGAIIEHDNLVEAHANICPGTVTSGRVRILEGAYLGTGTVVLPDISIGREAVVGAGAVVTASVPDKKTVAGIPARSTR